MRLRVRTQKHDSAVSTVLGGIMLLGLFVIILVTLRASFVPNWETEREMQQMHETQDQLASFKGLLDRFLVNQASSSATTTISLGDQHTTFLGTFGQPGQITFEPGLSGPSFRADLFDLVNQDGNSVGNEQWSVVSGGEPISEVRDVESLRLRFSASAEQIRHNQDSVILQIIDAAGVRRGTFVVALSCDKDCKPDKSMFINVESVDGHGNILYNQGYAVSDPVNKKESATYWVDVLNREYRFASVVEAAPRPFTIALTDDGLNAEYAITYKVETTQGTVVVGSGTPVGAPLATQTAGGRVVYSPAHQYYPSQQVTLENGAMILEQDGAGAVFLIPPAFSASPYGTSTILSVTQPGMAGVHTEIGGNPSVQLVARLLTSTTFTGSAPNLLLNYSTNHPDLYEEFFETQLARASLTSTGCGDTGVRAQCNYILTKGATWVQVHVFGFLNSDADNAAPSPEYDVVLDATLGTVWVDVIP